MNGHTVFDIEISISFFFTNGLGKSGIGFIYFIKTRSFFHFSFYRKNILNYIYIQMVNAPLCKIIGKSILYASMLFAIGSVEMSSKFSVQNFSKDQQVLQRAADSLYEFLVVGLLWTVGVTMILYSNYGMTGLYWSLIMNFAILIWIWWGYNKAFRITAKENKLEMPYFRINF